ncbi:MAG: hypothetical protein MRK01_06970 [Candidatus Scalindua sp.]|nr:hypothetical protein [Candidatus Scalindua sp.]
MKKIFIMVVFFLFCFHGIWIPRGNAKTVSVWHGPIIVKDLEKVPVDNEKKLFSLNEEKKMLPTLPDLVLSDDGYDVSNATDPASSDQDWSAQPASNTKSYPKVYLNLWRFIILSG